MNGFMIDAAHILPLFQFADLALCLVNVAVLQVRFAYRGLACLAAGLGKLRNSQSAPLQLDQRR
jgi:hypothetical protein